MGKEAFEKFFNHELKGAAKKEAFKKQKREAKAELRKKAEEEKKRREEKKLFPEKYEERKKKYRKHLNENASTEALPADAAAAKDKLNFYEKKRSRKAEKNESNIISIENTEAGVMPLNKYLAHCGISSRREAAEHIKNGSVTVNDAVVKEPGFKINSESDIVVYKGKKIALQKNLVYILLNKPKDFLTTTTDPQGRKTVSDLVKNATSERVYPVGRLDRNTTGVLLLTNDGELAQKLTHPKFGIKKIYEAKLDKPFTKKDAEAVINGVTLEDGFIQADSVGFVDPKDKTVVGIEIHSGKNRIVRRIFEHLGYEVKNLDRVMFANLTKKNVERGHYRFLKEKEVRLLKFMNKSFVKKDKSDSKD